jgi:hypothetical protein
MKKIFVILMVLLTSFVFGLDTQPGPTGEGSPLNKAAVKRELEKEQAFSAKYQKQLAANEKIIKDMSNDAKKKDYQKRLTELRQRKYVLEYNIKKTRVTNEQEKLLLQLEAVIEEYAHLLYEFETFVNGLN